MNSPAGPQPPVDKTPGPTADPAAATVQWATAADADGVFALLNERLAR